MQHEVTACYIAGMATKATPERGKRKVPTRTFQIEPDEWDEFADTAAAEGRSRGGQLRLLVRQANAAHRARSRATA